MGYDPFLMAAKEAQAAYEDLVRESTRWIPVGERMPPKYKEILVSDGGFVSVADWTGEYFTHESGWYKNVTHWRPLPMPPGVIMDEQIPPQMMEPRPGVVYPEKAE